MSKSKLRSKIDLVIENYINQNNDQLKKVDISTTDAYLIKEKVLFMFNEEFGINITDLDEGYIKIINSRISKTRKRWAEKELTKKNKLHMKVEKSRLLFDTAPDISLKFSELYGASNPDDLDELLRNNLIIWRDDKDSSLISFKYIEDKLRYQIEIAIQNDMQKLISDKIIAYKKDNRKITIEMPETVSSVPFNFSREKNIKENRVELEGQGEFYQHIYQIDDEKAFETLIGVETIKSDTISRILKQEMMNVLNSHDLKVFLFVISKREANFFSDGKIVLPLVDIVKYVYPSDNSHYYNKCRASLHKLAYQRVSAVTKSARGFTIGIFDSVLVGHKNEQGQEMVDISVSEAIVSDLLKRRTIKLYRDSLVKLEEPASQVLIFKLQAKRISHLAESGSDAYISLDISFFRGALYFSNKREYENAKVVERALTELIDNKLIISSYQRKGYSFYVKFLPFTEIEARDLLEENGFKDEILEPAALHT